MSEMRAAGIKIKARRRAGRRVSRGSHAILNRVNATQQEPDMPTRYFISLPDGSRARGNDPQLDEAIALSPRMEEFLAQDFLDKEPYAASRTQLADLMRRP